MPKYLVEAHFTTEGAKGIAKEGGTARRKAITKLMEGAGGKLESYYFAFGGADAFVILDLPDNVTAAALSLAVNKSGAVATKTIVLLTPEEMDQASKKVLDYHAPGHRGSSRRRRASNAPALRAMAGLKAPVAQLDRVSVFETEGWRFEPVRARHSLTF